MYIYYIFIYGFFSHLGLPGEAKKSYLAVFCDRKVKIDVNDNDFLELLEKTASDIKSDYDKYRERSKHFDDLRNRIKENKDGL